MHKLYKKGLLLSAVTMAACALPSMASAATFDGIGNHTLTSTNLAFTSSGLGGGSSCTHVIFEVNIASTTAGSVTSAPTFDHCTGVDGLTGQTATVTATGFPWAVTPVTGGVVIDGVHMVIHFSGGGVVTLTGSLAGGAVNNTTNTVTYTAGSGLQATALGSGLPPQSTTVTGTLTDVQHTLRVT